MPFPPGPPFDMPLAPTAFRARFSSFDVMCSFSVSARFKYSSILLRMSSLDFSFFSSGGPQPTAARQSTACTHI